MILTIFHFIKLFYYQSSIKLSRGLQFRQDFILGILINMLFSFFAPLLQFLIYNKTEGYPGWSPGQLMVFQASLLFWAGLSGTLFGDVRSMVTQDVSQGSFDKLLVMPVKPIIFILTRGFQFKNLGTLLAGVLGLFFVISNEKIEVSFWGWLQFWGIILSGIIFYISLLVIYATLVLKFVNVSRLSEILDTLFSFSNYPAEIYSGFMKSMFLVLFPLTIWVYFPSQALLGRITTSYLFSIASSFTFLACSIFFWNRQLKKYTSAGG